jgi:hypothetical protein
MTTPPKGVAKRSLSRRVLLRLFELRPDISPRLVAFRLGIIPSTLEEYQRGDALMPLDVQERLVAFAVAQEPRLARAATRLRQQVQGARRYETGQVVGHMTAPANSWKTQ